MSRYYTLVALIGCFFVSACGDSNPVGTTPTPSTENDLKILGDVWDYCMSTKKRGPANLNELMELSPDIPATIQNGQITINYGAPLNKNASNPAILAHDKECAQKGGYVLLQNGTVKQMDAAEFGKTPKAKR